MSEPQENQTSDLHLEQIQGLVEAAGVDGAREILETFWRSTTNLLESLTAQVSENTLDAAARTAHAVKGSAANVGAQRLSETASRIEAACKSGDRAAAAGALEKVQQDFEAFRASFHNHLAQA